MKRFAAITGLPRSGSTLLCNILNQNPRFFASSTSPIPVMLQQLSHTLSSSPEVKSELAHDREATEYRVREALRSLVTGWYSICREPVVFDKSRAWVTAAPLLYDLFPKTHLIVCVRDLRDVFASVEKQHAKFPAFDDAQDPVQKTVDGRANRMFAPDGLIGGPIVGVEDLVRRSPKKMTVVQYEHLASAPKETIDRLYADMGEKRYRHNLKSIKPTSTDLDALYLHKFPHDGSGPVRPVSDWSKHLPADIAETIMARFANYNQSFGYS